MANARVHAVARPQRQPAHVVAHERDLAEEVQRPQEALDEQVGLQEEQVALEVDVFGGVGEFQGFVPPEHEVPGLAAYRREGGGRFVVDVGEHEAFVRWCLLLRVGGIEDLEDSTFGKGVLPDHGAYLRGKLREREWCGHDCDV